MSIQTLLLEFPVLTSATKHDYDKISSLVCSTLEVNHFGLKSLKILLTSPDMTILTGPRSSLLTIRIYREKCVITVNIEYYLNEDEAQLLSFDDCRKLELQWAQKMKAKKRSPTLPRILRGANCNVYFPTTDNRILEYDIDNMLYDAVSPFQHIQIGHSKSYGNMLILDGDPNLAESDLVYTESIMRRGVEDYEGKEILILGGGDGGLLYELLKENPKHVTMIEIDGMVIDACRKYMNSVCGDVLDNLLGKNYEIVIEDCCPYLEKLRSEGIKFDYIFDDLTTIPVNGTTSEEKLLLEFQMTVIELACSVLKIGGKLMAHGPGASGLNSTKLFEKILYNSIQPAMKIKMSKQLSFVPSFMESWAFYQVQLEKI